MNQVSRNVLTTHTSCFHNLHTFSLKPLSEGNLSKQAVSLHFSPVKNLQGKIVGVRPEFNLDRSAFTPAFILPIEKGVVCCNSSSSADQFQNIQETLHQETNALMIAKPTSKYCYVCKQYYSDYIKHIQHKIHKKNIKNSPISSSIQLLINLNTSKPHKSQKKLMANINSNNQSFSEKPKKKRIIQNSHTLAPQAVKIQKDASESTNINNSKLQLPF